MIMSEPLENLYFNWLCAKVVDIRATSPSLTYWTLFRTLHTTEFVWLLSGDDNRAEDGKDLRREFLIQAELPDDIEWRLSIECSMLEMLIAFSRRAEFMTEDSARDWFWEFIDNMGFKEANDANADPNDIAEKLERIIWRLYETNGEGGIFPLNAPLEDQTKVEIWYQFCDYLVDHDRLP